MAVNINADTVVGGAVVTADASGVLALQAGGNTALTINSSRAIGVGASGSFGTSGQVLTSAGSAAAPTWSTPATGAMTLISTQTASGSSSISWTGLATYDTYVLIVKNATTSNNYISYQVGTGSTPTYVTANYAGVGAYITTPSGTISSGTTSTTSPEIHRPNSNGPIAATCTFYNMLGSNKVSVNSQAGFQGDPFNVVTFTSSYQSTTTGPYTAIKIQAQSGTFSGTFSLYGVSQ